mmetsp:Transcript_17361/g.28839  ORF Transcript_17361/g.28839 Transcript_17361/m.28839 type:complete len:88 (-) Transcript_17361:781-1044(-)
MGAVLGSMVQNGKLAAWAMDLRARALKSVDLPTLGSPRIPTLVFMVSDDDDDIDFLVVANGLLIVLLYREDHVLFLVKQDGVRSMNP